MEPLYIQQQPQKFQLQSNEQNVNLDILSADELIKLAEKNSQTMNYDKCFILFEEALKKYPDNEEVLTSYGYFLINVKSWKKAKDLLSKAILANPHSNSQKYLKIAPLFNGEDSAKFYMKAIEILTSQAEALNKAGNISLENINEFKKDLSKAYSALGELYITDLAGTESAVNEGLTYLRKAIEINQANLGAYFILMSYYNEMGAHETVNKSACSLMEAYKQVRETYNENYLKEYPNEICLGIVKVFIELQEFSDALLILEDLFVNNPSNMEALYLIIYCNFMLENFLTCKKLLGEFNKKKECCHNKEILAAIEEIEESLRSNNGTRGNNSDGISEEGGSHSDGMEIE